MQKLLRAKRITLSLLATALALSFSVHADGGSWRSVAPSAQKECTPEQPCRIMPHGTFEVRLVTARQEGLRVLERLELRELKTGKIQSFDTSDVNQIEDDELFEVLNARLRPGENMDLALMAYSSAREGPMYYYFMYDSKRQQYIIPDHPVPKLIRDPKTGRYHSELQKTPYKLGADLKFYPIVPGKGQNGDKDSAAAVSR